MDAPVGTVALVFSDVEGSTALWDRDPAAMRAALAAHDEVMRRELERAGGYEVKTEGDAFMIAFTSAGAAIEFCLAAQAALLAAPWPARILAEPEASEASVGGVVVWRGLRVRMGAHVGEPDCKPSPITGRMDYFGPMVNRAARVAGLGHGGQVLASEAAWAAAGAALAGAVVTDLGEHALKGLSRPERIHQLAVGAPAARTLAPIGTRVARRTNVAATAGFVGRARELDALLAALRGGEQVVTVVGAAGAGKSRLAREAALALCEELTAGAWLLDLSDARTVADLVGVGAAVLGVQPPAGAPTAAAVSSMGHALAARGELCLVLDNCDTALAGVATAVARWIELAPRLRVLATSRERLGLAGEQVVDLPPMTTADGIALVTERAARSGARLGPADQAALALLVERLDGLPLALELAAARLRVLAPAQLADRLARGLDVLKGGRRDAPGRHASLEAAIGASWDLLDEVERAALAQCMVFHGGFTLDAAEAVVVLPDDGAPVLDVIAALRDKSLLASARDEVAGVRFAPYQSVRAFVRARVLRHGPARSAGPGSGSLGPEDRHAAYYVDRGEALVAEARGSLRHGPALRAGPGSGSFGPGRGFAALAAEVDNLRAAFERQLALEPELAARAALVLDEVLALRGPAELRASILDAVAAALPPGSRVAPRLHLARARAARLRGELAVVDAALDAAAGALAAGPPDPRVAALVLVERGAVARGRADRATAAARLDEAVAQAVASGDPEAIALAHDARGSLAQDLADLVRAEADARAAIGAARGGNPRHEARLRQNLAAILQDAGRLAEAEDHYRGALELARSIGDRRLEGVILANLGNVLGEHGLPGALEHVEPAIGLCAEVGDRRFTGIANVYRGLVLARAGDLRAAAAGFEQAIALTRDADARFAAMATGYLGVVRLLAGADARAALTAACAGLARAGDRGMHAYFLSFLACAHELAKDPAAAAAAHVEARAQAAALDQAWLTATIGAFGGAALAPAVGARTHVLLAVRARHFPTDASAISA